MTPKEKANELGKKFYQGSVFDYSNERYSTEKKRAKERALICVDEILDVINPLTLEFDYWEEVEQEIKKL